MTIPTDEELIAEAVAYVKQYGGNCRDCADHDGVCPSSGLPCGDRATATRFVLDALRYGVTNGYVRNPLTQLTATEAALADLNEWCDSLGAPYTDGDDGPNLSLVGRAQNALERLLADMTKERDALDLRAEINRMAWGFAADELSRSTAECERLRAALAEISLIGERPHTRQQLAELARTALEGGYWPA
jgi:hypothetical protein